MYKRLTKEWKRKKARRPNSFNREKTKLTCEFEK